MRLDFCSSLALNGLPKLAALMFSIERHISDKYFFWILCEDNETLRAVAKLPFKNIKTVLLDDFDRSDKELLSVKSDRDAFEYNCTLRPAWMLYVLDLDKSIEYLTYVDNDLFFYSNPESIYHKFGDSSVLLTTHRISKLAKWTGVDVNVVGKYNAGWLAVKNDDEARKVLKWWRNQCIAWCYRIPSDGKFGEQKYLDEFHTVSKQVGIVKTLGANVAPWNMNGLEVRSTAEGEVMIGDEPLIFFHFHALKTHGESAFKVDKELGKETFQLTNPNYIVTNTIFKHIYKPYLDVLRKYLFVGAGNKMEVVESFSKPNIYYSFKKNKRLLIVAKARVLYFLISISKKIQSCKNIIRSSCSLK
jgi:hypothetical protein